jgi:hypothetical protein
MALAYDPPMRALRLRAILGTIACAGIAVTLIAGCGGTTASTAPHPKHIAYISEMGDEGHIERLVPSKSTDFAAMGLYRQMPAQTSVLPSSNRIARVDGANLAHRNAHGMASKLRAAIDGTCTAAMRCTSGLVGLDDVAHEFHGAAGEHLLSAMRQLAAQESPHGGSYADRVVMYIDYDILADLGNATRARKWRDAMAAAALGNSMWLEMYKSTGVGTMDTVSLREWREVPRAATAALAASGAKRSQIHLLVGPWLGRLPGQTPKSCPDTLTCVWHAAASTPLNQKLLRNGVGMYRYTDEDLAAFCVFIWTADPGAEPDRRVRDNCAHWLAGKLDYLAPGSGETLN